uniref:Sec14p n=1 Tax=Saccharum hybrid cultivar ROC22 TaxID=676074 RepID=A0A3R5V411_9POAL|nr:Sec14p [Saccharum hybrid cultivar ROC22]
MFRRKHGPDFNSNDAEQREAKISELKAALGTSSARGEKYCSEACLKRYLEARNWNVAKARKMLEESLKWRAAYRPEDIRWPDVSVEAETGKMYRASFRDREGRTVVVMKPTKQNTSSHEGQIRFLVYTLENAISSLPEGQEKMVWLIDFTGWTVAHASPIKTSRETANILQNHFPERLAIGFLFNPPKVFEAFYKVIKIFLDPKSIEKVNFVYQKDEESMKVMYKYTDPEVLPVEFGGKNNVVHNHEEYSELMIQDDIKTANFWAVDAKTDHANSAINGTLVPEVAPQPSLLAAKAS